MIYAKFSLFWIYRQLLFTTSLLRPNENVQDPFILTSFNSFCGNVVRPILIIGLRGTDENVKTTMADHRREEKRNNYIITNFDRAIFLEMHSSVTLISAFKEPSEGSRARIIKGSNVNVLSWKQ